MAEVAVSRHTFQEILSLIARLRAPPAPHEERWGGQLRQGTTAEVRLDQGKATEFQRGEDGNPRPSLSSASVLRDIWLCRRPKSKTMALLGTGIRRMPGKTAAT
jgi:hypothetical protein